MFGVIDKVWWRIFVNLRRLGVGLGGEYLMIKVDIQQIWCSMEVIDFVLVWRLSFCGYDIMSVFKVLLYLVQFILVWYFVGNCVCKNIFIFLEFYFSVSICKVWFLVNSVVRCCYFCFFKLGREIFVREEFSNCLILRLKFVFLYNFVVM